MVLPVMDILNSTAESDNAISDSKYYPNITFITFLAVNNIALFYNCLFFYKH